MIFNNFRMLRGAGWRPLAGRIVARGPYVGQAWFRVITGVKIDWEKRMVRWK